jgi:hypothetical protein
LYPITHRFKAEKKSLNKANSGAASPRSKNPSPSKSLTPAAPPLYLSKDNNHKQQALRKKRQIQRPCSQQCFRLLILGKGRKRLGFWHGQMNKGGWE